jgi:hypothetical protein
MVEGRLGGRGEELQIANVKLQILGGVIEGVEGCCGRTRACTEFGHFLGSMATGEDQTGLIYLDSP